MTVGPGRIRPRTGEYLLWGVAALFIIVPLGCFLAYGFFSVVDNSIVYRPTIGNFADLLSNASYRVTFLRTMRMAFEVSAINLVLGYATAYFIWLRPPGWRNFLVIALAIPLLMSYIIKIYAMRGVLGTNGLLNSALMALGIVDEPVSALLFNLTAVRITLSVVLLPFMVLPIYIALERIPASVLHAASDLGANELQTFTGIILPLSLPGGIVGAMFTFVLASGDFLAPELVGGIEGFTYGRLIFSQFGLAFNWPLGAALSILLMCCARGHLRGAPSGQSKVAAMRRLRLLDISLASVTTLVYLALYLPILLVFVLSFFSMRRGRVNWETFSFGWYARLFENEALGDALRNSLFVGGTAVAAAAVFATVAALHVNARPSSRSARLLEYVIFLPFLLPPIITGLSLLIYFREAGIPRGIATIIVGHAVFVLAIIYRMVLTRLNALSRSLVEAAHDLGASRFQTFRYIVLPNLRMPLLTAGILAFALSFDETMITLFLTGTDATLPVRLYAMMRVGFTPEINALITLILVFPSS